MTQEQKIGMLLAYKGMSQAALARLMNTTPSNLNQKIKRGTLTVAEMEQIAALLGAQYTFGFSFPDGTTI